MAGCCDNFTLIDGGDEFKAFPGLKGDDGTTFYPHVSEDGTLSWTNNGGLPNPDPVKIEGADGKSAYEAAVEAGYTGTEEEFNATLSNIGDVEDTLNEKAGAFTDTASGMVASFIPDRTITQNLGVTVKIKAAQSGSGTPSPDNKRPITGWNAVQISRSGENTASATTYTVNLPSTCYGGALDATGGTLTTEWDYEEDIDYSGIYSFTQKSGYTTGGISYSGIYVNSEGLSESICDSFVWDTTEETTGFYITVEPNVPDTTFFFTLPGTLTRAQWTAQMNQIHPIIVCPVPTPATATITPVTIPAISSGTNNVWSNAGPVEVTFAADLTEAISGKQDAPSDAGVAGQVLGLDDDLNPVWLDQTGGGGGTTNYNNLTNKPRINGVMLSGDKSGADLGLASASDIPTVPVQSVNGEIGAVVLDASDVGAVAEPQTAGTAGQVLGLDSNLNPTWVNQGGGGSSDYNALSNKPSIEGVTLSGNKTASDLGLALATDIPTVPVQSVNGKTGAVVLTASDVGAKPSSYEAPVASVNSKTGAVVLSASDVGALPSSTTIPSKTSDLTNDSGFVNAAGAAAAAPVQSVNGSTGAVTVSVPTAYTSDPAMDGTASPGSSGSWSKGDHVHPTDTSRQATITASGLLKGDGSGGVSAAVAGTDYLTPGTNYSPVKAISANYSLTADDVGKTILTPNTAVTITLPSSVVTAVPIGAEFAFSSNYTTTNATFDLSAVTNPYTNINGTATRCERFRMTAGFDMVVIKRLSNATWGIYGNVEVVT